MPVVTVHDEHKGRCRVRIESFRRPIWCSFDYVVEPFEATESVPIEIGDRPDAETGKWFPFVRQGIEEGIQSLEHDYDIRLVHLRIHIPHIYSHPVDTNERACQRYGKSWIIGFGRSVAVKKLGD